MKITEWTYWEDDRFLNVVDMTNEEYYTARKTIIEELKSKKYKFSGLSHRHMNNCTPVIDNKWLFTVSMRDWGRIMQEAYDLPNEGGMGYVAWAWSHPDNEKEVYPND